MARKELIWKRNTKEDSQTMQSTLSRLSSTDKENFNLELVNTVEPTVQDTVLQTVQQSVEHLVSTTAINTEQQTQLNITNENEETTLNTSNQETEDHNYVSNQLEINSVKEDYKSILSKADSKALAELANTHTEREHRVYLLMYCESRKHNSKDRYFSAIEIARLLGLKHRRNIVDILQRLEMKKSISIITSTPGQVLGKEYRIYEPEEILERRKKSRLKIHSQTKNLVK